MSALGLVVGVVQGRSILDCDHRWAVREKRTKRKKLRLVGVREIFELNYM